MEQLSPYIQNPLVVMCLYFLGTGLLLLLFHFLHKWMCYQVKKTSSIVDDILVESSYFPLIFMILALGICSALAVLAPSFPFAGIFTTGNQIPYIITLSFFWFCFQCVGRLRNVLFSARALPSGLLKRVDAATLHSIINLIRAAIIIVFLLTFLSLTGVSIAGILAFGGIGGIIVGFAIKDTLANFFSGLLIIWERPFVIGEWIRCPPAGIEGVVEKIGWRITQIRTFDNRPMFIPNSTFMSNYIETPQRMTSRRIRERIGIRYVDMAKLRDIVADVNQMLLSHKDIKQPSEEYKGPLVVFDSYGEYSLIFMVDAMTNNTTWHSYNQTKEDILFRIATIIEKYGAQIAFPTQSLHVENYSQEKTSE